MDILSNGMPYIFSATKHTTPSVKALKNLTRRTLLNHFEMFLFSPTVRKTEKEKITEMKLKTKFCSMKRKLHIPIGIQTNSDSIMAFQLCTFSAAKWEWMVGNMEDKLFKAITNDFLKNKLLMKLSIIKNFSLFYLNNCFNSLSKISTNVIL